MNAFLKSLLLKGKTYFRYCDKHAYLDVRTADNLLCRETSRAEDIAGLIIKSSVTALVIYHHQWSERDKQVSYCGCMVAELRLTVPSTDI